LVALDSRNLKANEDALCVFDFIIKIIKMLTHKIVIKSDKINI